METKVYTDNFQTDFQKSITIFPCKNEFIVIFHWFR